MGICVVTSVIRTHVPRFCIRLSGRMLKIKGKIKIKGNAEGDNGRDRFDAVKELRRAAEVLCVTSSTGRVCL